MAQAQPEKEIEETQEKIELRKKKKNNNDNTSGTFKFNAHAPEFVPRSHTQMPISGYFYPYFQYNAAKGGADWICVVDQEAMPLVPNPNVLVPHYPKDVLTEGLRQKLIKQVEYQFSDLSLLANENLVKQINKDPGGYVPIAVVSSTKKLKSLIGSNHYLLAQALRSSTKLEVSADCRKVRRKQPFTLKEKEELQSRTVVAENLPSDHSHQNMEKIFNVVGSVKTIRICHPQESNSSHSKGDPVISNKLHALIEYENVESAEKAVEKLNDERNWRKGLRVRLRLRRSPKSVLKNRKSEFYGFLTEDEGQPLEASKDNSLLNNSESVADNIAEDTAATTSKKGWAKGRGKSRQRTQTQNGRGQISQSSQPGSSIQCEALGKLSPKGPRMPDGTKGFNMGRGKPVSVLVQSTAAACVLD